MQKIPFIAFIRRHWLLITWFTLALLLSLWEPAFTKLGALIYLPVMCLGAGLGKRLLINLGYRTTLDADSRSGRKEKDWDALSEHERAFITNMLHAAYFIGCAIIAAALAK